MLPVRFHVRLQRHRLDEAPAAYLALVRFLSRVDHDVMLERFGLAKGALAVRARVLLDATVDDADVAAHVAWV